MPVSQVQHTGVRDDVCASRMSPWSLPRAGQPAVLQGMISDWGASKWTPQMFGAGGVDVRCLPVKFHVHPHDDAHCMMRTALHKRPACWLFARMCDVQSDTACSHACQTRFTPASKQSSANAAGVPVVCLPARCDCNGMLCCEQCYIRWLEFFALYHGLVIMRPWVPVWRPIVWRPIDDLCGQ